MNWADFFIVKTYKKIKISRLSIVLLKMSSNLFINLSLTFLLVIYYTKIY